MGGFAADKLQDFPVQFKRRHDELLHALKLADAGEQVEQIGRVFPKFLAAGEQAQIRINLGGGGIVIARAKVNVPPDAIPLPAHHQRALGMDLVAHQTVNHVYAVLLQLARPFNVVRLVKARPQFHHGRHLFAIADRIHQGANNPRIAAGAIERHFDGERIGVGGGGFQKLHHARKTLVRVMEQDVALGNRGKNIRLILQRRGHRSGKRRVAQLGRMAALIEHHQPRGVHRTADKIQILRREVQSLQQGLANLFRTVVGNFQPHRLAAPALVQLLFHGLEQVRRVFLIHVELAIAGQAESPVPEHLRAGKEIREKLPDQMAQKHIIPPAILAGQRDEPRQNGRTLHHRQMLGGNAVLRHLNPNDQVQRLVQQLRKRMRRVNGQRRQHRMHLIEIERFQPGQVRRFQFIEFQQPDFVFGQGRLQFLMPADILVPHHLLHATRDGGEDFRRGETVHTAGGVAALNLLFQPGHPHFEKFVQIGTGDRKKLKPLQEGIGGVKRLFQNPLVEFQPAQFPVQKWFYRKAVRHKVSIKPLAYRFDCDFQSYIQMTCFSRCPAKRVVKNRQPDLAPQKTKIVACKIPPSVRG